LECYNNYFDKMDYGGVPDEIVLQPIDRNKDKYPYWNVWFRYLDSRSDFHGNSYRHELELWVRGVRFCRDLKKLKSKLENK
jgi:hypothetical protein